MLKVCRLIIVDAADSWGRGLADEQIISKFIPIDFSDEAAVFDKCLAAIKQVDKVTCTATHSTIRTFDTKFTFFQA